MALKIRSLFQSSKWFIPKSVCFNKENSIRSTLMLRRGLSMNLAKFCGSNALNKSRGNDNSHYLTMEELKKKLAEDMGVEMGYRPMPADRSYLLKYLPKKQSDLPKRAMRDSFLAGIIPLSTDLKLQDRYISYLGSVRIGRLMEDMDIFAVIVAEKHILIPNHPEDVPNPQTLVTALVDRIDFTEFNPSPWADIKISGHVSWVGTSSIEVVVWLEQFVEGAWRRITRALFVLAARDPLHKGGAIVNGIEPADEREKAILQGGESRKKKRKQLQALHVSKVIPTTEEQVLIHDLYLRSIVGEDPSLQKRKLPDGCVWMGEERCRVSNIIFTHPEDRNLHNTVFGGFIMRHAVELSSILCFLFSKYRPKLHSISDITFSKPVQVNELLRMHAQVVYTKMQYVQIVVYAETFTPTADRTNTTNSFHFTFKIPQAAPEVIPHNYQEAMMYIDGRRHFMEVFGNDGGKSNNPDGIIDLYSKL